MYIHQLNKELCIYIYVYQNVSRPEYQVYHLLNRVYLVPTIIYIVLNDHDRIRKILSPSLHWSSQIFKKLPIWKYLPN